MHSFTALEDSIIVDIVFHAEANNERYNFYFEANEETSMYRQLNPVDTPNDLEIE